MIASRKALIVVAAFVLMALGLPWGGNVPAAFAQIQVTSANPDTGDQGTLGLNVTIGGKGFKKGAKANFYLKGTTNPAGITVRATKFVSDASLVATIDIAAGATPDDFDIVVANADGRTGKGTELFKVAVKIDPCTAPDPVPTLSSFTTAAPGQPGWFDSTFGDGTGKAIGPRFMMTGYDRGAPVAIDSWARIVAVGIWNNTCATSSGFEWAIARYLPTGTLDATFGSGGMVRIAFAGGARPYAVVIQPDGKIVVAGSAMPTRSSNSLPVVIRLTDAGSFDSTFDGDGVSWVSPGGKFPSGLFYSVVLQSDGSIVAAGETKSAGFVSRLLPNGALDPTFNGSGKCVLGGFGLFFAARTQIVGSEERIVVAGTTKDASNHFIGAVWRFTHLGAPDSAFGTDGVVTTSFRDEVGGSPEDEFRSLAIDASNQIVVAGYALTNPPNGPSEAQMVLARFTEGGSLDVNFGPQGTGKVRAPSTQAHEIGRAMALQSDGGILVGGDSYTYDATGTATNRVVALWRFTIDGSVDASFGAWGCAFDPVTSGTRVAYLTGLALQPDGNIVAAGHIIMESNPTIPLAILARFWQ